MIDRYPSREAFEKWAAERYPSINLYWKDGEYRFSLAKEWWELWQAAMAHKEAELENLKAKYARIGLDIDRAMKREINEQSPIAGRLRLIASQRWQPIETAPRDQLVMVYTPPQESDWPDAVRIDFDHIDTGIADDYWYKHGEHYEHFCCVAKPEGSIGPKDKAPYTHWMPLPAAPLPQG